MYVRNRIAGYFFIIVLNDRHFSMLISLMWCENEAKFIAFHLATTTVTILSGYLTVKRLDSFNKSKFAENLFFNTDRLVDV